MNLKDIFQNDDNQELIEKLSSPIYITKRTLKLDDEIYQFSNITGLGVKRIKKPPLISFKVIVLFFIGGLLLSAQSNFGTWSILLAFVMQGINWWYQSRKLWSLLIYLPSSKNKAILSEDRQGLMGITYTLYQFMESEEEKGYIINIDQKNATIGVGYAEKINNQGV